MCRAFDSESSLREGTKAHKEGLILAMTASVHEKLNLKDLGTVEGAEDALMSLYEDDHLISVTKHGTVEL